MAFGEGRRSLAAGSSTEEFGHPASWLGRSVTVCAALVSVFSGCGKSVSVPALTSADVAQVRAAGNYLDSENYRIEPGDTLQIRYPFHGEMDQGAVMVGPDGKIVTASTAADIDAAGLTTQELEKRLASLTSDRLRNPEVVVTVAQYSEKSVYIAGEVGKPGPVPYRKGLTPLQAVIAAGGFLDTGKAESVVLLRSAKRGKFVARKLDLDAVVKDGVKEPIDLAPHDVLFVPRTRIAEADLWVRQHITELIPFVRGMGAAAAVP